MIDTELKYANPAGRLHALLSGVEGIRNNVEACKGWNEIFKSSDGATTFRLLTEANRLLNESESLVKARSDLDQSLYLKYFGKIRSALSNVYLHNPWPVDGLNEASMLSLAHLAERLNDVGEKVIPEEELESILGDVNAILKSIEDSEIEEEAKKDLIRLFELARSAIIGYRLDGAGGIRDVVEQSIGILAKHFHTGTITKDTEVWPGIVGVLK